MVDVSVLLSIRDGESSVVGALESALGQSHGDLEVLVVDGSIGGDETVEALSRYEGDDRVRVLADERARGTAERFNRAAAAASGEFLCPLEASDRWHPTKVERQLERFAELPSTYGLVYTGGVLYRHGVVTACYRPSWRGDVYPEILTSFEIEPHSSHMIRRDAFESAGGFDESFEHGVDWEFAIRLSREYRFEYVDAPLVQRFLSDEPTSGDGDPGERERLEAPFRIRDSYADAYESHPSIYRRFEKTHHVNAAVYALRSGDRLRALRHAAYAFRRQPSLETGAALGCSVLGRSAVALAARLRRVGTNARTSPDAIRRGTW